METSLLSSSMRSEKARLVLVFPFPWQRLGDFFDLFALSGLLEDIEAFPRFPIGQTRLRRLPEEVCQQQIAR